jgi:hypothetical protein
MYELKNSRVTPGLVLASSWRWLCLLAALCLLCAGCAGGGSGAADLAAAPVAGVTSHSVNGYSLEVLPETYLGAPAQGEFRLAVEQSGGLITVRVLGEKLAGLRAFYAQLHCPAGVVLDNAQAGGGLGRKDDVLSLCHAAPGVVDLGAVLKNYDKCEGVDGGAELARVTLRAGAAQAVRNVSAVPARTVDHPVLYVNCSKERIEWEYRLAGDFNQDGTVGIADLTALALHWGEVGDVANGTFVLPGTSFPVDSIEQVLDTSGDLAIGVADLTAAGINYGARIAGWNIYRSMDPAQDFPDVDLSDPAGNGAAPSKITPFAYREFGVLREGNPAQERLRFSISPAHLTNGMAYWVRPVEAGVEGAPSNWSSYDNTLAAKFSLVVEVETLQFDPGILLTQDVLTLGPDQVVCQVDASNATTAKYIVFRTLFNSLEFNPLAFTTAPIVAGSTGGKTWLAGPLRLTGVAKFSSVDAFSPAISPSGDFTVVRCVFQREPQSWSDGSGVATIPGINLGLAFEPGTAQLSWLYGGYSDLGQDGDVWWDDLATISHYWGPIVDDPLSAAYAADANQDGWINMGEVTCIGAQFGKSLTGYNVYTGVDPTDESTAVLIGNVPLSAATGDPMVDRLRFSFTVPDPQPGQYLWVKPESDGYVGNVYNLESVQIP